MQCDQPDTQQDYRRDLESVGNRQMALIFLGAPYFFSTVFINKANVPSAACSDLGVLLQHRSALVELTKRFSTSLLNLL